MLGAMVRLAVLPLSAPGRVRAA
eukprot:COSAG02_NODE_25651_length_652_cov_1.728752_2_plen_22_part_01